MDLLLFADYKENLLHLTQLCLCCRRLKLGGMKRVLVSNFGVPVECLMLPRKYSGLETLNSIPSEMVWN